MDKRKLCLCNFPARPQVSLSMQLLNIVSVLNHTVNMRIVQRRQIYFQSCRDYYASRQPALEKGQK